MDGNAAVTLNVTVTGTLAKPAALRVMVPVLVPAAALVGSAETVMVVWPVVPLVGVTDSQFPVLEGVAVNATAEALEVLTDSDCVAGTAPLVEVKVRDVGAGTSTGAATVRFTVTDGVGSLELLQALAVELDAAL
jgi:hypothetical protein